MVWERAMRIKWIFLLILSSVAYAQTTTVSFNNLIDSDFTVWANGTWQVDFNPNPNYPGEGQYFQNGAHLSGTVTHQKGSLNGSGSGSVVIYDSSTITPVGSGWKLTICPNASSGCGIYTFSSAGASQNISSNVSAILPPPRFTARIGSYGYNSGEAISQNIPGATYWDVTQQCQNFFNSLTVSWACTAAGANTPAGPAFAVNFANSSVTAFQGDNSFTFAPSTHVLTSAVHNLKASAQGFGTSTTGITAATTAGYNFVEANPNYGTTEQYGFENMIPNVPSNYHFLDNRSGMTSNFYHNFTGLTFGNVVSGSTTEDPATIDACLMDGTGSTPSTSMLRTCKMSMMINQQPGWNLGNPTGLSVGGWEITQAQSERSIIRGSGIAQTRNTTQWKFGTGDNVNEYRYVFGQGGWVDPSGEGQKSWGAQVNEYIQKAAGTCVTGCSTGSTAIKITNSTLTGKACTDQITGDCQWGTGQYLIDTTVGGTSTTVTNIGTGNGGAQAITISGTVPVSNAVGTNAAPCGPSVPADNITAPPFSKSYVCSIGIVSGAFDTSHLLCFSGTAQSFHECVIPTAVGTPSGGFVNVTMNIRKPHLAGFVYQGGMAGYGIEFTSYNITPPNGGQLLRYLFDIVGSTGANTLQGVRYKQGIPDPITAVVNLQSITGIWNLQTLTNSGTTVSLLYNSTGSTIDPRQYQKRNWVISGATDSAFNGTCTNLTWTSSNAATCTLSGLSGVHTATSAQANMGVNNVILWPMAEIIDTQNEAQTPPTVDGTLTLEPNIIAFAASDAVESPHHSAGHFEGATINGQWFNPFNVGRGLEVTAINMYGGNTSAASNSLLLLSNSSPDTNYQKAGGWVSPPNMINFAGMYQEAFTFDHGPNEAVYRVVASATQNADPNYTMSLYIINGTGSDSIVENYTPSTGAFALINTGGSNQYAAIGHRFIGTVTMDTVAGVGLGCLHADINGLITKTATDCGSGAGSMTWPAGGAGIPNYSGSSSWGTSYNAGNQIPSTFIPTLNQNTSGTAANLSGTPTLPNGTKATTQAPGDNTTNLATTAYVDSAVAGGIAGGTLVISGGTLGANTCNANATISDTGLTTSGAGSRVTVSFTSDPALLIGWGTIGGMVLQIWPSAANVATYHICNQTTSSITYSSITFGLGAN